MGLALLTSLYMNMQLTQEQLFKRLIFILIKWFDILVKNHVTVNIMIYFWIPFHRCINLMPEPHCLKDYSFVVICV